MCVPCLCPAGLRLFLNARSAFGVNLAAAGVSLFTCTSPTVQQVRAPRMGQR